MVDTGIFEPNTESMMRSIGVPGTLMERRYCILCPREAVMVCPRCRKPLCEQHETQVEGKYEPSEHCLAPGRREQ